MSVTKLDPGMLDKVEMYWGDLNLADYALFFRPAENKVVGVTVGRLQDMFNSQSPSNPPNIVVLNGGTIDVDVETVFIDGGDVGGDQATIILDGGTIS